MSYSHPQIPTPHFDHDARALDAHAAQNHRNALGLNEDIAHVEGWLSIAARRTWSAARWPVRLVYRLVRRDQ